MNKSEFIKLIQDASLLKNSHITPLKQVVHDFPFFTNAQILLTKTLYNEQHYEFEKTLRETALAVPDREVLYYYIHSLDKPWQQNDSVNIIEEHKKTIATETPVTTIEHTTPIPIVEPEQKLMGEEKQPQEQIVNKEHETTEKIEQPINVTQEIPKTDTPSELIELELPEEVNFEELKPQINETDEKLDEVSQIELEDTSKEHSFMEWLKIAAHHPLPKTADIKSETETSKHDEQAENSNTEIQTNVVEITKEDIEKAVAQSNVNDFQNILDKFVRENPSISRPKSEFFNPINMAKQSVEEDEDLVTETLASLYYKQGNLKKAIRTYEKLCLKYPSKITYFANLIQKIKTELKD